MPSVRMSQSLRDDIVSKSEHLFREPLAKANDALADDFGDRLFTEAYDKVVGVTGIDQLKLPDYWYKEVNNIQIKFHGTDPDTQERKQYQLVREVTKSRKIINIDTLITGYWNRFEPQDSIACSPDLFLEYHKYEIRRTKLSKECNDFAIKLSDVLKRCNTLKQFLDAWPQGESLVPDDVIARLNEPTEKRGAAERIEPEVATELSSVLIKRTLIK